MATEVNPCREASASADAQSTAAATQLVPHQQRVQCYCAVADASASSASQKNSSSMHKIEQAVLMEFQLLWTLENLHTHTHTRDGDDHHNASIFQLKRREAKDLMNLLCKPNQKKLQEEIKREH